MRWPLGPVFDHRALDAYRTIAILPQVAGGLAVLACLYSLHAGRATRRLYETEWATEAYALAHRIDHALAPADGPAIHSDQVQAILNGSGTATNNLRALANLQWRHSSGLNKHMCNSDIRSALSTFLNADSLAHLS